MSAKVCHAVLEGVVFRTNPLKVIFGGIVLPGKSQLRGDFLQEGRKVRAARQGGMCQVLDVHLPQEALVARLPAIFRDTARDVLEEGAWLSRGWTDVQAEEIAWRFFTTRYFPVVKVPKEVLEAPPNLGDFPLATVASQRFELSGKSWAAVWHDPGKEPTYFLSTPEELVHDGLRKRSEEHTMAPVLRSIVHCCGIRVHPAVGTRRVLT